MSASRSPEGRARRTPLRRAVVYVGVIAGLTGGLVACGGSGGEPVARRAPAPPGVARKADARLTRHLVGIGDFPDSWQSVPLARLTRCARWEMPGMTAFAHSALLASPVTESGAAAVAQLAWTFADARAAVTAFARMTSELGDQCVQKTVIDQLKKQTFAIGTSPGERPAVVRTRGHRSMSYNLKVSSATMGAGSAYINLIQWRHSRAIASLVMVSVYDQIRPDVQRLLSRLASRRLVVSVARTG